MRTVAGLENYLINVAGELRHASSHKRIISVTYISVFSVLSHDHVVLTDRLARQIERLRNADRPKL